MAGVVQGWAAIIMGMLSGSIPWYTMMVVHKKSELLQKVDDTMAVLHTHAIAGTLGGLLTGFFAVPKLNRYFFGVPSKYVGLLYGLANSDAKTGFSQMGIQVGGILYVIGLNVLSTTVICLFIRMFIPLRMSDEDMELGDDAAHGEEAYAIWGDGEKMENSRYNTSVYDVEEPPVKRGAGQGGQVEMT